MANTVIQLKKSATPSSTPSNLANGELAINFADGKLFYKDNVGVIKAFVSALPPVADSFGTVNANGTLIVADTSGDVLTLLAGNNITIIGDAVNDRITVGLKDSININGTATFTGPLTVNNGSGAGGTDEGGEIQLANAASNSVLSGPVSIDIFQNKLRFFEINSPNRGAFINLASAAVGVGSDLLAGGTAGTTDNTAREIATSAFAKANAALANTNGITFGGTLNVSQNLSADKIISTNNGQGENFKVGDDAWIGDTNVADTVRIKGQQNPANAYISFGNNDGILLGRAGSGNLTYGGNTVWHSGIDGAGSGLDADLLDGQQGTYYAKATDSAAAFAKANNALANTTGTFNGSLTVANSLFVNANTFLDVTATGKLKHLPEPITRALIPYRTSDFQYDFFNAPALSSDASIMAVGARYYDANTATMYENEGAVLVYDWNGTGWVQRGTHITANTPVQYGNFGGSVSIDSEGSILAVGSQGNLSVYIFDWNGTGWTQRSILTGAAGSSYGQSVSLDGPGTTLIVSAVDEVGVGGAKKVYTYDWNGTSWVQRGTEITGATFNFGLSVAISRDGKVLAISDSLNIYIYDRNSSAWTLRSTIAVVDSYAGSQNYSKGLALNEFGDILAYSVDEDYYNDPVYGLSPASTVAMQDWNGTSWVLRGYVKKPDYQIVYTQDDRFGVRLSLNDTGSILVAGTTYSSRANTWWGNSGIETGSIHTFSADGSLPGSRAFSMGTGWIEDTGSIYANTSTLIAKLGNKNVVSITDNTFTVNTSTTSNFYVGDTIVYSNLASAVSNSNSGFIINQTWNNSGQIFTGLTINVNSSAASASSYLLDVKQNNASAFYVRRYTGTRGEIGINSNGGIWTLRVEGNSVDLVGSQSNHNVSVPGATFYRSGVGYGIELGTSNGAIIYSGAQEAANTIGQRRGTAGQTYRVYGTFTDTSNYERLSISANATSAYIQTENAGTGSARDLRLGTGGATRLTISSDTSTLTSKFQAFGYFVTNGTGGWKLPFGYGNSAGTTTFGVLTDLKFAGTANGQFTWTNVNYNSSQANANTDTGLARHAAGVVRVTDSSTGNGSLLAADIWAYSNVGIGTTTPTSNLHVIGTANITSNLIVQGADVFTTLSGANTAVGAGANNYANATFVKLTAASQTITGDLAIVGNLSLSGNTVFSNAQTLIINDPLIYLAGNNYSSDIVDIGFIANYVNATGSNVHTGLYREHADKMYYLFQGYDQEPANNHIGALSNNMTLAVLNADLRTSNLTLGGTNTITWITSSYNTANIAIANVNFVNTIATSAFAKANAALANTSGVWFNGNLNIGSTTSNVYLGDTVVYANLGSAVSNSNSGFVINQTWNNASQTFTTLKINAANTNSGVNSLLTDMTVDNYSIAKLSKTGTFTLDSPTNSAAFTMRGNDGRSFTIAAGSISAVFTGGLISNRTDNFLILRNTNATIEYFGLRSSESSSNTGVMEQRTGVSPQTYHLYGTYTDVSNYERLRVSANSSAHYIVGEEAGTGAARPLHLGSNNSINMTIDTSGNVGIGTTTPRSPLEVYNGIRLSTTSAGNPTGHTVVIGADTNARLTTPTIKFASGDSLISSVTNAVYMNMSTRFTLASWLSGNASQTAYDFTTYQNLWSGVTLPNYTGNIVKVSSDINSAANTIFNGINLLTGDASANTVYNTLTGLRIDVSSGNNSTSTRYAASFIGGNVGIGTTTPTSNLHVVGTANVTGSMSVGGAIANSTTVLNISGSAIISNNVPNQTVSLLKLQNNENSATPGAALDFQTINTNFIGRLALTYSSGYGHLGLWTKTSSAVLQPRYLIGNIGAGTAGYHFWYRDNNTIGMMMTANGDIGIGSNEPTAKFSVANGTTATATHIYGTYTDASNYERINITANTTAHYIIGEEAGTGLARPLHIGSNNVINMTIDTAGRVGIGTTTPTSKLVLRANTGTNVIGLNLQNGDGTNLITLGSDSGAVSSLESYGILRIKAAGVGTSPVYINAGGADVVSVVSSGNVGIGTASPSYKLEVVGSFAATTKSFVIKHPTKKGMKLRYGSLEGPENGVYVRGRITDSKTIELPDYWHKLVDKDSITVSLTGIGKAQAPTVGKITAKKITLIGENIDCFYHVFAERKDVEKLIVEIDE